MFAELKSKIKRQKSIDLETGKEAKECNEKRGISILAHILPMKHKINNHLAEVETIVWDLVMIVAIVSIVYDLAACWTLGDSNYCVYFWYYLKLSNEMIVRRWQSVEMYNLDA